MKILCHLPIRTQASSELQRAAKILGVNCELATSGRHVVRFAEESCDQHSGALIVTTDEHADLLREVQARAPAVHVLMVTTKQFTELPYFLSLSPIVSGFFISPTGNCSAQYFLNFLRQEMSPAPLDLAAHLDRDQRLITLQLDEQSSKSAVLRSANDFFLWCLGDADDTASIHRARQLEDSLDELLTNVARHGPHKSDGPKTVRAQIQLGFDGSTVGIRVQDPYGCLRRHNLLERLATDHAALDRLGEQSWPDGGLGFKMILDKKQRVIINLHENISTEVICLTRLSSRQADTSGQPVALEIRSWPRATA